MDPNSPEYSAWKNAQVWTPADQTPAAAPSSPYTRADLDRDSCELLIPLDGTFALAMSPNDDGSTGQINLPFVFSLYGANYNYCWINNNGNVSFDGPYFTYSSTGFPYGGYPMVAPFWADVDTRGTGAVYYRIEANNMVVIWDHVGYFSYQTDKVNTFELIISDGTFGTIGLGNNACFSYTDMTWTTGSASGGSGGFGGTPATVGINKGDGVEYAQIGRFDHQGTDYDGPFANNDGVNWLTCQTFYFNTGGYAANVAPIFVTVPPNPVVLTVGDVWNFTESIISPEAAQTTGAVVVHNLPEGMAYTVTPGNICSVAFTVTATAGNIGYWHVTVTATDDGTPNLSSSDDFYIQINAVQSGYKLQINSYDLQWYTGAGYQFGVTEPLYNDPNDLHSEILLDGLSYPVSIFTPYTFGENNAPQPNYAFTPGSYSVIKPNYIDWLPNDVTFVSITTDYSVDFLGQRGVPVELSSFTAIMTAENYVQLSWISQSETNMLGYRVYRNETNDQATSVMITPVLVPATNTSQQQSYSFTDDEVTIGQTYYYWLESVDMSQSQFFGPQSIIVQGEVPPVIPEISAMQNAYPNPFKANTSTSIEIALKAGENGTVTIYNVLGQVVKTFNVNEGNHTINWNGKDSKGNVCGSGIYFYKLSTPSINQTKKMVIIK